MSLALLLLSMILMRLVWMQLRVYRAHVDPKAYLSLMFYEDLAPTGSVNFGQIPLGIKLEKAANPAPLGWYGSPVFRVFHTMIGSSDNLNERFFIRNNQSLLMFLVFFLVIMVRFITSSWTCALIVGAVVMSRGKLLSAVGEISQDIPLMTLIAGFYASLAHCVRTASPISLGCAILMFGTGVFLDGSFVGLAGSMPLMLGGGYLVHLSKVRKGWRRLKRLLIPVVLVKKLRRIDGGSLPFLRWSLEVRSLIGVVPAPKSVHRDRRVNLEGGGLLQTLRVPFLLWCFAQKRWLKVSVLWFLAALFGALLLVGMKTSFVNSEPLHGLTQGWLFQNPLQTPWIIKGASYELAPFVQHQAMGQGFWLWAYYWIQIQFESIDIHLIASLLILVLCLFQPPSAGFPGFSELCWMVVFGALGLYIFAFLGDLFDEASLQWMRLYWPEMADLTWKARVPLDWLEPVILSLAIAGIYNLLAAIDQPKPRRPTSAARIKPQS